MKLREALGLGTAGDRGTVPVSLWVPVAAALVVAASAVLLALGLAAERAVPIGLGVGLFLAVPCATVLTLRPKRRR
jgi:hypothetical protein